MVTDVTGKSKLPSFLFYLIFVIEKELPLGQVRITKRETKPRAGRKDRERTLSSLNQFCLSGQEKAPPGMPRGYLEMISEARSLSLE